MVTSVGCATKCKLLIGGGRREVFQVGMNHPEERLDVGRGCRDAEVTAMFLAVVKMQAQRQ